MSSVLDNNEGGSGDSSRQYRILHLSSVLGSPLVDSTGSKVGKVEDLIVRPGGEAHPPVSGLVARIGRRELFIPIDLVVGLHPRPVQLAEETVDLRRFERRPGELLLGRDLAGRHLIHVVGARLVRANEIELAEVAGQFVVIGVDTSRRPTIRHLVPNRLGSSITGGPIIDWEAIEPFVGHVPTARLRIPYRKLAHLRPAQIADLVEAASHDEGEEIIEAVGQDRELEADVFEELDPEHQREFIESRSDAEAARVLSRMAPDDVADLIADLDQERRLPLLEALPATYRAKVRILLSYHPETAGGLMNPDFLQVDDSTTVAGALDAVRCSPVAPEALTTVYSRDQDGRLSGAMLVVTLLKSSPGAKLVDIAEDDPVSIRVDADLNAIVRKMSDFNLQSAPVVDDDHRMLGVVTVDDVLELMLPTGWRRDYGMTGAEEG